MLLIKDKQIAAWVSEARKETIEECARIVEAGRSATLYPFEQKRIAAAIRALKEKP